MNGHCRAQPLCNVTNLEFFQNLSCILGFFREIGQILRMKVFEIPHKGTFVLIYTGKKRCFVIEVSSDVIFLEILYQVKFWHEFNLVLF